MSARRLMIGALLAFLPVVGVAAAIAAEPAAGAVFRDCADCPEMVLVPPGNFMMGSSHDEQLRHGVPKIFADQESPRHRVAIGRAFAIGRTEITRERYARFVNETQRPDSPDGCGVHDKATDTWGKRPGFSWRNTGFAQTDANPAICVSWQDARDYTAWLSGRSGKHYRLPSEAEWEYAARAGTDSAAYWGDSAELLCENANVMTSATYESIGRPDSWTDRLMCSGVHSYTVPVASYEPNRFGLYDMIGNVWEWVDDCYHKTFDGAPTDGSAWRGADCSQRLLRGGAFHSAPFFGRVASREGGQDPRHAGVGVGFRVVRELDGAALPVIAVARRVIVGDAVRGQQQFGPCTKCHTVEASGADLVGPNLHGFIDKPAATVRPGFVYSAELRRSGLIWTEGVLDAFIANPAAVVPHTSMSFAGISRPQTRANIIAYMKQVTTP